MAEEEGVDQVPSPRRYVVEDGVPDAVMFVGVRLVRPEPLPVWAPEKVVAVTVPVPELNVKAELPAKAPDALY